MIENTRQLAKVLNISYKALTYLLYIEKTENCYTSFNILKKNGTTREIAAPNPKLSDIKKKLANFLYLQKNSTDKNMSKFPCLSHGFELNKSIITNAKRHRNKNFVINMDLENFFDSFHFGRVRGYFNKNKNFQYPLDVCTMLAQITCFKGKLPQGSPSSPIITNLICQTLDVKLYQVAKRFKLNYTRYADDLTFSTNDNNFLNYEESFINEVSDVIKNNGLTLNAKKTRVEYRNSKQTVTGLIVNKKINIDNNYFKDTKAMAHSYYKNKTFLIHGKEGSLKQLEGRFSFIDQLDKFNNKYSVNTVKKWVFNRRELEFQRFLFYKNFLNVEKPIIITEGKTDPLYIKAALMSLYKDYPNLIEKEAEKFVFKLNFFKKQKNFQYYFRFVFDGGDTMQKIYELYKGNDPFKRCNSIIAKYNIKSKNPVILLQDNETVSKDKPLAKFLNSCKLNTTLTSNLKTKLHIKLFENLNLYLATLPLVEDKNECEIEDLFKSEILKTEIEGRTFLKKVDKGDAEHYCKDVFSKYVYENYKTINFEKFKGLLDNINNIILNHKI